MTSKGIKYNPYKTAPKSWICFQHLPTCKSTPVSVGYVYIYILYLQDTSLMEFWRSSTGTCGAPGPSESWLPWIILDLKWHVILGVSTMIWMIVPPGVRGNAATWFRMRGVGESPERKYGTTCHNYTSPEEIIQMPFPEATTAKGKFVTVDKLR